MMKQKPHLAMLPSPGMGHIIPMVEFAKRLIHKHDLSVTLIIPDSGLHPNEQNQFLESLPQKISLVLLPRPNLDDCRTNQIRAICHTIPRSLSALRNVVRSLVGATNLVALVVDFLGTDAFDVAREFNVSPYVFFPSNAMLLSVYLHVLVPDPTDSGESHPGQDLSGRVKVPGCIPFLAEDLPDSLKDPESFPYKWMVNLFRRYKTAAGIAVNTFIDIEGETIKALQKENYPPVYPVGPLIRQTDSTWSTTTMKWLDGQPKGSVLLVSFGSMGLLSQIQIQELAFGLELSGKRFLWAVQSPDSDPLLVLPEGFVERTKGRGFLVSGWAPQAQILGHGSTGGFLTHCGWNSVLESVVNGVPMIALPLYAEQKMNATLLTESLKTAIRPKVSEEEEGLVGRMDIANSVKSLMEGEEGEELRERTRALKGAGEMALDVGGQSTKSLAEFVDFLNK